MFVSGKIRGNAPQLADYLLTIGKNERVVILDVDGNRNADAVHLRDTLYSMELNSELTRTKNSVYHGVIRPDPDSQHDRALTMDEWNRAVEIKVQKLVCEDQRRVVVLHELEGYFHAHIVIERYDHDRGVMVDFKHNYKAHDEARFQMEKEFGHKRTPQKNPNLSKHKKTLTAIWKQTNTGTEFIKQARANGYQVAKGTDRPFRVVDENGRSFNLLKQLDGIKTKEVRQRLGDVKLIDDKTAIEQMSTLKQIKNNSKLITEIKSPSKQQTMIFNTKLHDPAKDQQLFNALRKEAFNKTTLNKETAIRNFGVTAKIPEKLKSELLKERFQWEKDWSKKTVDITKPQPEDEIEKQLNAMYREYLKDSFQSNGKEITYEVIKPKNEQSEIRAQIKETAEQVNADNREQLIKEIQEARERNRNHGLER